MANIGAIRLPNGSSYNINARSVNGHTVAVDVPSNAQFTDTTYEAATTTVAGLMSGADKAKLDGITTISDNEIDSILAS